MARPNLSVENIALALAALGASAAVSCTKASEPAPVRADKAPAASAAPPPPAEQQIAPAATAAAAASQGPSGADQTKQEAPPPGASAAATATARDIGAHKRHRKGAGGSASCGAGTCTSDIKKK